MMNIYHELFENWIPDMPGSEPSQNIVIYEPGQSPGANDGFFKILSDFYTSFHTDYGPVDTIASFILIYIGISILASTFLWNKWSDWASRAVQIGCGLLGLYLLLALCFGFSDSALLNNNSTGMLSRLFLSMAIHVPILIVLLIIGWIVVPQDPAWRDPYKVMKQNLENEIAYLDMLERQRRAK